MDWPYVWRVRSRLPERFGQRFRVLIRGGGPAQADGATDGITVLRKVKYPRRGMNSALVEFEDGTQVVTSRNYLRKVKSNETESNRRT